MESLKRALESIGRMWAGLSATQRVILGAAALLMVVLLVVSSVGTSQAAWVRVAGAEANIADIQKKLRERNQKFELRGSEIYVPKEDADRLMVDLAGEGTVNTNAVFKFLEQSDIFATRWQQEKRLQIALQSRLESMVRSIESVRTAIVLINPGSTNHQLGFAGPKPSASVQVDLKEGMALTRKNVQAIAGLVARAVSGVEEDHVLITDTKGNAYRAVKADSMAINVENFRDYERSIEADIQKNIKEALSGYPGVSVVVRVQAKSGSSEREELKHGAVQPVQIDEVRVIKGGGSKTPPRIKGETPNESVEVPSPDQETRNELREQNVVDKSLTKELNPAGEIQRISVGVMIPIEEGPRLAETERQLPKLRDFVLRAAGPPAKAEDVSVQIIPTRPLQAVVAAAEKSGEATLWLAANWPKIVLGLLAVAAVFAVIRVVQRAAAQDTVEELQALTSALTETQEGAAELAAAPGEGDLARVRQGLQEMVGRNPQGVAASLKSFMSGR